MPRKRHDDRPLYPDPVPEVVPCPLCARPLAEPANRHHLLPVSRGGRGTETVLLHKICHDKIHSVLTETELKKWYPTIESLQQQEEIARFIRWVHSKAPSFYDKSVKRRR